jgi:DNA-binding response OmpR family regulator
LTARIRAVLRRQAEVKALEAKLSRLRSRATVDPGGQPEGEATAAATDRGLRFDDPRRRAWFRGQPLDLRPKEYDLLSFLARNPGQVFTREALLSRVWGYDSYVDERTVDVHVRRLRGKLAAVAPDAQVILTEWGVGYRLAEDL